MSSTGTLIHVDPIKKQGYVLTSASQFLMNKTLEHYFWFGAEGSFKDVPKECRLKMNRLHVLKDPNSKFQHTLGILQFDLPEDFTIEPMKIYDGQGYKKGEQMTAAVVSYGAFRMNEEEPINDLKKRAGIIGLKFVTNQYGDVLQIRGTYAGSSFPVLKLDKEFKELNTQAWPFVADGGSPAILKTSRGYQLAGIYAGMILKPDNSASHYWHFAPSNMPWINDIITGTPSNTTTQGDSNESTSTDDDTSDSDDDIVRPVVRKHKERIRRHS